MTLKQLNEGIIDPVLNTLSSAFFDKNKKILPSVAPIVKKNIKLINDMISNDVNWKNKIKVSFDDAVLVGARATYQYSKDSDADINIGLIVLDKSIKETDAIKFINEWLIKHLDNKVSINGIKTQFRVSSANENEGVAVFKAFDGVYDISGDKWIKEPHQDEAKQAHTTLVVNNKPLKEKYLVFKKSLQNELSILNELDINNFDRDIVKKITSAIANIFQPIYDERTKVFQQDEKFLKDHGRISLNWSDANIFYKWMEDDFGKLTKENWKLVTMLSDEVDDTTLIKQIEVVKSIKV